MFLATKHFKTFDAAVIYFLLVFEKTIRIRQFSGKDYFKIMRLTGHLVDRRACERTVQGVHRARAQGAPEEFRFPR